MRNGQASMGWVSGILANLFSSFVPRMGVEVDVEPRSATSEVNALIIKLLLRIGCDGAADFFFPKQNQGVLFSFSRNGCRYLPS